MVASGKQEMQQITEVISLIRSTDMSSHFVTGRQIECFGPLVHHGACNDQMNQAMGEGAGGSVAGQDCIIKGLDLLLDRDILPGDGVIITTKEHTTYMLHSKGVPQRWYLFDSLDGSMVCVMGRGKDVFQYKFPTMMSCSSSAWSLSSGLEPNNMYTAVILGTRSGTQDSPGQDSPGQDSPGHLPVHQAQSSRTPRPVKMSKSVHDNTPYCRKLDGRLDGRGDGRGPVIIKTDSGRSHREEVLHNAKETISSMGAGIVSCIGTGIVQKLRMTSSSSP